MLPAAQWDAMSSSLKSIIRKYIYINDFAFVYSVKASHMQRYTFFQAGRLKDSDMLARHEDQAVFSTAH